MEQLQALDSLAVKQKKEMGEILTGFETKNRYSVINPMGSELYFAEEVGGSFLTRTFLKAARPFTIELNGSSGGQTVLTLKRPFRWFFYELSVYGSGGNLLGSIKRQFDLLRRVYSVMDANGQEMFQLFGPILHPWTFRIMKQGEEIGKITKKWSGMLKESFTDADNFGVMFPAGIDVNQKAVLLGAVFLIDFAHFENKGN